MIKEFKEFALKGNVVDLAVGIIIGAAFTKVVNSLVSDILMEPEWKPSTQGTSVAFEVDDLDATVEALKAKGIAIDMGIFETPVCRMAIISDPDGNHVTLHHRK